MDFVNNCGVFFERHIDIDGDSYLTIFGHHVNGGFICIPDWCLGCEVSDTVSHIGYNAQKLVEAGLKPKAAGEIAKLIDEWLHEHQGG